MSRRLAGLAALALLLAPPAAHAQAVPSSAAEARVLGCINAAAEAHRVPPAVIVILLRVEGGRLGAVSQNTNDTVDIGPMQINTIWVPQVARRWRTTPQAALVALRDNFCANVEAGAWILRQALDQGGGDFWSGVGIYHSRNPVYKERYLRRVMEWTLRLRDQSRPGATPVALRVAGS